MGPDPDVDDFDYDRTVDLVRELDSLKRNGSNLLVVGSSPDFAHSTACSQFLGDGTHTTRRRLFVTTNGRHCWERLPDAPVGPFDDHVHVIRYLTAARSATAATAGQHTDWPPSLPETTIESADLSTLGLAIHDQLSRFESIGDRVEPAEIRVCLDSVAQLIDAHGRRDVFRFLHVVTRNVRDVRGMGHVHLPVDRDDEVARLLAPLFDAVVEVDAEGETFRQRWHLQKEDLSTDWL